MRRNRGTVLVETAITLFPFTILLFAVFEGSWFLYSAHTITNAARETARMAAMPEAKPPNDTSPDKMLTQAQLEKYAQPFLAVAGMRCTGCVTLTNQNVIKPNCLDPRTGQPCIQKFVIINITTPYKPISLAMFKLNFSLKGVARMRDETSRW